MFFEKHFIMITD